MPLESAPGSPIGETREPVEVVFLHDDPGSASARVRVLDHLPGLAAHGVHGRLVALPKGRGRGAALDAAREADVVVLERRLLGERDLVRLRRAARALVLDLDDATWERPGAAGLGGAWSRWRGRRRLADALRAADLVLAGSEHLRAVARGAGHPRVRLVPPVAPRVAPAPPRPAGRAVRLVWTGSRSTLPYLEALDGVLAAVARRAAAAGVDVRLDVVADAPARLPSFGGSTTHLPWSLEAEARALAGADVGLYPLAGDAWSRGKCAYKLRLYMAHGLPSVAARAGAGVEVLEAPEAGLLADDDGEWVAALGRLVLDPALRARLGVRARGLALARDDHGARTASLAGALREAAAVGKSRLPRPGAAW